jgi:hypothetical protein
MSEHMQETLVDFPSADQSDAGTVERISDNDRFAMELLKLNRKVSLLEAEKAILSSQNADANYKYAVLQLYMMYGLSQNDTIDDSGKIIRAPK